MLPLLIGELVVDIPWRSPDGTEDVYDLYLPDTVQ